MPPTDVAARTSSTYDTKGVSLIQKDTVRTWMTPPPLTIGPEASLAEAYEMMRCHHVRRLPVVDGEKLVGVITINDVRSLAPLGGLPLLEDNDLASQTKIDRVMTPNPI